jgi:hypothetical protein
MGRSHEPKINSNHITNMTTRNGNALRDSATSNVAERIPHRGRSLNIARLPFNIREDLNNRLLENVPVKDILIFLNTDSTVRHYMEMLFQGRPISEQNISEWRQGGYQEWLAYRSCIENVRDLSEDAARVALTGVSAEHPLLAITATFAEMVKKWGAMPEIAFNRKLIVLQDLVNMALALRRSEQKGARLQLDRERLEILREKHRDKSKSSYSPRTPSHSGAPKPVAHPLHSKAPEIRRPPAPDLYPNDPDWPATPPEFYRSGPSPDDPEIISQAPPPASLGEPGPSDGRVSGRDGGSESRRLITSEPTPESTNRFD